MPEPLIRTLAEIVGGAHVLGDPALRAGYERDWTGRWGGEALAVVRPACTEEVAAVVRAAGRSGTPIVTQGGNTGLVGGGVPRSARGEGGLPILLSTTRLDAIAGVDTATAQLQAGAGATLAAACRAARRAGLDLVLDLAARDSATLGGLAACDAGGLRALRHGTARRQVAGLQAVLADGTVVESRMTGLVKDTAGYDLAALLVGSEGTLGIITAVRWSLAPRRNARAVALVGLERVEEAVALLQALRPALPTLEVCELMQRAGIELTCAHLGIPVPAPAMLAPFSVLLECAAPSGDPLEELAEALDAAGVAERVVSAADAAGRERLFAIRELHAEAINAQGVPLKFDVGVPLDALSGFCERAPGEVLARAAGARTLLFGHLGDGNLHVNVLGVEERDVDAVEDRVLGLAASCGGTVSAEHGIGVHKVRHLGLTRTPGELRTMWAIKRTLDPAGILNPGVALPA
ncbi:MAG TPA: FAD-binding oxidoreductase, partial [Solirubrobacteraceae bacterium]|nr:FAD-binding oxidoreductase [Solirubrobacteraceae bacterium]